MSHYTNCNSAKRVTNPKLMYLQLEFSKVIRSLSNTFCDKEEEFKPKKGETKI